MRHNNSADKHAYYLEELIKNLDSVGEKPKDISWIMHEGIWLQENSKIHYSMCDLVLGYADFYCNLIELKGSRKKRAKALRQLDSTKNFIDLHFPTYSVNTLKIVFYIKGNYEVETYDTKGERID